MNLLNQRLTTLNINGWTIKGQMLKKDKRVVTIYAIANMSDEQFKELIDG